MSFTFPNVPLIAGVPAVLRNAENVATAKEDILAADSYTNASSDDWGVFDQSGARILNPDTVISVEFGGESRISDYPTENGGFQSYNKVATPFEVRCTLSKGGSIIDRQAFIDSVEALRGSITLVDIATPDCVYFGVNLTHVGQVRSASAGAGLATVEMVFQEVRKTAKISYAQNDTTPTGSTTDTAQSTTVAKPNPALTPKTVKSPPSSKTINQGSVQPKTTSNKPRIEVSPSGRQVYVYDKPIRL